MKKIFLFVWINLFIGLIIVLKIQPKIIEKEVVYEKIVEIPIEKIVYKEGKEIVEKIVEKPMITYKNCTQEVVDECRRIKASECMRGYGYVGTMASMDTAWVR